jgi:hypothetical protein
LLPGGETEQMQKLEYVFTERLSGTMQVGGSPLHNTIFELNIDLIEALYVLTEEMVLPPESLDEVVPDPKSPEPVPEPESQATPSTTT